MSNAFVSSRQRYVASINCGRCDAKPAPANKQQEPANPAQKPTTMGDNTKSDFCNKIGRYPPWPEVVGSTRRRCSSHGRLHWPANGRPAATFVRYE